MYTTTIDRNPQLLASLVAAHRVVLPPQAASRRCPHPASSHAMSAVALCSIPRRAHSTSSRHARSLPLCVMPRPSPRRGAADAAVPHHEVVTAVDTSAAATLDLRSRHHEIRSGQTRSGLFQLYPALPSSPLMLQAYVSSVSGVSYACYKCFMWMLQK